MTNLGFEQALARLGIPFARAKVGDRYVLEMMQEKRLAARRREFGPHLCLDKHTTGDGIVSALQVLRAIRRSGTTLAELCRELELYPQELNNVKQVPPGFDWEKAPHVVQAKQEVERRTGRSRARPASGLRNRAGHSRDGGRGRRRALVRRCVGVLSEAVSTSLGH